MNIEWQSPGVDWHKPCNCLKGGPMLASEKPRFIVARPGRMVHPDPIQIGTGETKRMFVGPWIWVLTGEHRLYDYTRPQGDVLVGSFESLEAVTAAAELGGGQSRTVLRSRPCGWADREVRRAIQTRTRGKMASEIEEIRR